MKIKSHSGAKKRFKTTGKNKLRHAKAAKNHLLGSKSKRQKKYGRKGVDINPGNEAKVRAMLPYA